MPAMRNWIDKVLLYKLLKLKAIYLEMEWPVILG